MRRNQDEVMPASGQTASNDAGDSILIINGMNFELTEKGK
jgi:hypothetical protein